MSESTVVPDVLTPDEAARYLRVSEETIVRQAADGRIPGRRIEDTWRFLKSALDDWLRAQDSRTILLQQAGHGPMMKCSLCYEPQSMRHADGLKPKTAQIRSVSP